jgi:hypothetical protein
MNLLYVFLELVGLGLVFAVIRWAIAKLCAAFGVDARVQTVIDVIWVVICVFFAVFILLSLFGVGPMPLFGTRLRQ